MGRRRSLYQAPRSHRLRQRHAPRPHRAQGHHQTRQRRYDDNLRDYKDTIPQLFWHNAVVILSNGHESRIGTITSEWDHFAEWRRAESEDEPPAVSLETLVRGVCDPLRLLDLVENFTLYSDQQGKPIKLVAKNHQFLGVQRAVSLGLTEDELALFDILTRPGPDLSPKEEERVRQAARDLLATLKHSKLVLDWRKKQQTKAAVRQTIRRPLNRDLASLYPSHLLADKNELIYQHIYDAYPSRTDNIYSHLTY